MILGFGAIVLAIVGAVGASLAAPFAVVVGGVTKLHGGPRGGLGAGLLTWVALTTAAIVVLLLGVGGNAGSGVHFYGMELDELMALAPWALLLAAVAWVAFAVALRRRPRDDEPAP